MKCGPLSGSFRCPRCGGRGEGIDILSQYRIKERLDHCLELAIGERDKPTGWVPWRGKTLLQTLPNYGKDAEPVVHVVETWPILKGRGGVELNTKLDELKKLMTEAEKLPMQSIGE
jgi:hypothetical protein